jgi:hypothetical protein
MNLFEFMRKNSIKVIYSVYEFGGWVDCEIYFSEKEVSHTYIFDHVTWQKEEVFAGEFARGAKTFFDVLELKTVVLELKNRDKSKDIKIDSQKRKINNSDFTTEKDLIRKLNIFYNSNI